MTRKNAHKKAARARQAMHGGHYSAHYRLTEKAPPADSVGAAISPATWNLVVALRASANEGASFTPVMTGVPISLKVSRESDGRYFVECRVAPFSSPFLVVHEDKEAALDQMGEKLLVLLNELKTRGGPFIDNNPPAASKASFDFDGRYFEVEGATWLEAHENLRRAQNHVAGYIEKLAGLRPIGSDEQWGVVDGVPMKCTMSNEGDLFVVTCQIPWHREIIVKKNPVQFQALRDLEATLKALQKQSSDSRTLAGIAYCLQWAEYFAEVTHRHWTKSVTGGPGGPG